MPITPRKKEALEEAIADIRAFRFCGPSDDPDEITSVTSGFRHLVIQLQHLAGPLLPYGDAASHLAAIEVEIDNLYSAYNAHAEIKALLLDIEDVLDSASSGAVTNIYGHAFVAESRIAKLRECNSVFDLAKLIRLCEELNITFRAGCYFSTSMLTRGLLDHVPPLFGLKSFAEVASSYAGGRRSFKGSMQHLETGARNIADGYLHGHIRKKETLPEAQQVDFRAGIDALLAEIIRVAQ